MNRLTWSVLSGLQGWQPAQWLMFGCRSERSDIKRAFDLVRKGTASRKSRCNDPVPFVKYLLRVVVGARMGLPRIAAQVDPYSPASVWVFNGTFGYSEKHGGYVPFGSVWDDTTVLFKNFFETVNPDRIDRCWAKVRRSLRSPRGTEPVLVHDFDKPHVYFMRDTKSGLIKIGVSVHPGIRRKQLMAQLRTEIEIIHIISSAGYEEEKRLHGEFAALREGGEWFRAEASLLAYIEGLQRAA